MGIKVNADDSAERFKKAVNDLAAQAYAKQLIEKCPDLPEGLALEFATRKQEGEKIVLTKLKDGTFRINPSV